MNTAKLLKTTILALSFSLLLGACADNSSSSSDADNGSDNSGTASSNGSVLIQSPYLLGGSDEGAADFTALNSGYQSPYENDVCLNITPGFVAENSDFTVFKYESSNETFLSYDGSAYAIGSGSGGDGVTSMALADLTGDGAYELYYAYSQDGNSFVGFFDPAQKTANELSGTFEGTAIVLSSDKDGLTVCSAKVSDYESLTSMILEADTKLAGIASVNGSIELTGLDK